MNVLCKWEKEKKRGWDYKKGGWNIVNSEILKEGKRKLDLLWWCKKQIMWRGRQHDGDNWEDKDTSRHVVDKTEEKHERLGGRKTK